MDAAEIGIVGYEERATGSESRCRVESVGCLQARLGTQTGGVLPQLARGRD